MNFVKADLDAISFTFRVGQVDASFDQLVRCFGEPHDEGDGYKTDVEWLLQFEDGTVATIYNWKDGPNYLGAAGTPVDRITHWHIGGRDVRASRAVRRALEKCAQLA